MEFPDFLHRGSMSLLLNIVQGLCSTSVKDCPVLTVTWTTLFSIHSLTLVGNLFLDPSLKGFDLGCSSPSISHTEHALTD